MKTQHPLDDKELPQVGTRRKRQVRDNVVRFAILASLGFAVAIYVVRHGGILSWSRQQPSHGNSPLPYPHDIKSPANGPLGSAGSFEWSSIPAKTSLEFRPCYSGFECARLRVPLDYFNGTYPEEYVTIALAKLPAKVPIDDPRYGGPILINPGGPGGSGVTLALFEAQHIQTVVDAADSPSVTQGSSSAKYFDVIGFDPRGIGNTEPSATCMPDSASAWSWTLRESTEGTLDSSNAALGRLWSMQQAYGASCLNNMVAKGGPDIKQYINTASVATDMITIIERHADYVATQIRKNLHCGRKTANDSQVEKPKLQYWGFSYGTYLGTTFASMYPDRVGRLILDGVVNSDDYDMSLGGNELHDTEKAMNSFYSFCVSAGPERCPLTTLNSTTKDIEDRLHRIVQSLYHNPIPIDTDNGPEILTYSDARVLIFASLYSPMGTFPSLAYIFKAIEDKNHEIIDQYMGFFRSTHVYSCGIAPVAPAGLDVPTYAVLCSDGPSKANVTIEEFEKTWKKLESISPSIGSMWSMLAMKCASWKIRALHRYRGAFGGNTSHPILFITTTADPVTPLRSAHIMSSRFPGSTVLVQDSAGHCSISTPTPCTFKHIRAYYQTGVVPKTNTFCVPPRSDFSLNSTHPDSPFLNLDLAKWAFDLDDKTMQELRDTENPSPLARTKLANKHHLLQLQQNPLMAKMDVKTMIAARSLQQGMADRGDYFGLGTQGKNALQALGRFAEARGCH